MEYFRSKPLGFNKVAIINVRMPDNKQEILESFRAKLEVNPDILEVSYSIGAPVRRLARVLDSFLRKTARDGLGV